ncbi:MAG: hypothetical protein ACHP8A_05535 [Terriglobales bacterium]
MWHVLHLIARPIEALLGLFCILTAIVLYPDEEGRIQSKLEDFWIRVDDFKNLALSRHAAFMTGVAKFETRFLDRVFGEKLFSIRAATVSLGCSITSLGVVGFLHRHEAFSAKSYDFFNFRQSLGLVCIGIYAFVAMSLRRKRRMLWFVVLCLVLLVPGWILIIGNAPIRNPSVSNRISGFELYIVYDFIISSLGVLGFVCDVVFIAVTRRVLRKASVTNRASTILVLVLSNVVLAALLVGPYLIERLNLIPPDRLNLLWFPLLGLTNMFDVALALLFALLAVLLLLHRAIWPLLTRTLFRMTDIGTKGRRAILTTVGIALLGTSVFGGKFPELVAKLIEKFGG